MDPAERLLAVVVSLMFLGVLALAVSVGMNMRNQERLRFRCLQFGGVPAIVSDAPVCLAQFTVKGV